MGLEHTPHREGDSQSCWQPLKPHDWSAIPYFLDTNIAWRPAQMPSNLEVDLPAVRRFIEDFRLPYALVEIGRHDEEAPPVSAVVNSVDAHGQAILSHVSNADEKSSSSAKDDHILHVRINFDYLFALSRTSSSTADEQKELFAKLVDHAFQHELSLAALEEILQNTQTELLYLAETAISALFALDVFNNSPKDAIAAVSCILFFFASFTLMKGLTAVQKYKHRLRNDEQYRNQLYYEAVMQHVPGNGKSLHELVYERFELEMWRQIAAVPFIETVRRSLHLVQNQTKERLGKNKLFRSRTHNGLKDSANVHDV